MMLTQEKFVESILERSNLLTELTVLLGDVNESYSRRLATMVFILESCKASHKTKNVVEHIKENFNNVISIIEQYNIMLPEETAVIEKVVARLMEDSAGGTAGGISGGSGAAAGSISTAAAAATSQIDTDAIDAKTPRIYAGKKKRDPHNVILS